MKKMLLALTLGLGLGLTLPGCGAAIDYCDMTGPANAPWVAVYNNHVPPLERSGNVKPNGTLRVPKLGLTCAQLQLVVRFGSNFNVPLTASPASVYLPSPPTSGSITGQSFDATYGMPRVDYFDGDGYLIGSADATSVSSAGTSLQANMPNLSSVYSGTYQVKVTNKTYDGYYLNMVGSATMNGWGRDRPDSDGDGWYDDQDCAPYDPYRNHNCQTCGSPREPYAICHEY